MAEYKNPKHNTRNNCNGCFENHFHLLNSLITARIVWTLGLILFFSLNGCASSRSLLWSFFLRPFFCLLFELHQNISANVVCECAHSQLSHPIAFYLLNKLNAFSFVIIPSESHARRTQQIPIRQHCCSAKRVFYNNVHKSIMRNI